MTIQSIARSLAQMVAGECRWVGHEGIHVYAMGRRNEEGRYHAKKYGTVFRVVTGSRPYAEQPWLDLLTAANIVKDEVKA